MANFVRIKNLSRRQLRFGTASNGLPVKLFAAAPTGSGASALVDVNDPVTKRDLFRNLGSYAFLPDVVVSTIPLIAAAAAANGAAFAWQNVENAPIFVHRAVLDVTSPGLATSTIDVGSTSVALGAADVTNIFAAQPISVAGTFVANIVAKLAAADFVSGTIKTANGTGLVGNIYLHWSLV